MMITVNRHVVATNKLQIWNRNLNRKGLSPNLSQDEIKCKKSNFGTLSKIGVDPKQKLKTFAKQKFLILNEQYEQFAGIAEIRDIQAKVLEAESRFVEVTKRRISCQNQIDELKHKLNSIKDRLELMPKSSDGYLNLITNEHKLLREQMALDSQIVLLKEKEQLALDTMSKLLRQSHECERLRQDRSKYWNIITLVLSFGCSSLALIAQKNRSQKTLKSELLALKSNMDLRLTSLENELETHSTSFNSLIDRSDLILKGINEMKVKNSSNPKEGSLEPKVQTSGWFSHITGLIALFSWFS